MKNKGLILRKHEERNKDMALRMYKRKGNLSGNPQNIQVKMNGPTVLKTSTDLYAFSTGD